MIIQALFGSQHVLEMTLFRNYHFQRRSDVRGVIVQTPEIKSEYVIATTLEQTNISSEMVSKGQKHDRYVFWVRSCAVSLAPLY